MMAYEMSESARYNFGKFVHQFQPENKTLIRKLERILIKLNRQNVSLLFNQTRLNERLLPNYTQDVCLIFVFDNILTGRKHLYLKEETIDKLLVDLDQ